MGKKFIEMQALESITRRRGFHVPQGFRTLNIAAWVCFKIEHEHWQVQNPQIIRLDTT